MVVAACGRLFVARNPVAGVDTLDEPQVGERFESPVDGRDPDRPPCLAELVVNVLRAQAAVLPTEEVDDCRPCAAAPVAGRFERISRFLRPAHTCECIVPRMITRIVLISEEAPH